MPTVPLYMQDATLLEADSEVTSQGSDERGTWLILDRTVFHPQGGGQPADKGQLTVASEDFDVTHVAWDGESIRHYLARAPASEDIVGQSAHARIDAAWRRQ